MYNHFFKILEQRFEKNIMLHSNYNWNDILKRLQENPEKLKSLHWMEESGGEPNLIRYDKKIDSFVFFDCSQESPLGRRSLCYDDKALNSRKNNKPIGSALKLTEDKLLSLLTEEEYIELQELGDFDLKTSSWLYTPEDIRSRGGAIFGDKRFGRTFIYHNGAESYYSARGFRTKLLI